MKTAFAAIAVAALVLAACGNKSSHATCVDNTSAANYAAKFLEDEAAALKSGKLTKEKRDEMELEILRAKPDSDDVGAYCVIYDGLRKKYGI
jgi:outer membrane PBP1 activator LpoA protein